jgi:hypothetical protein
MRRPTQLAVVAALATAFIAPTAGIANAAGGFGDVPITDYFTEAIQWMTDEGITSGTSPGCFSPHASTTRAQAATFIHRSENEPSGGSEPFTDVNSGDYFASAVSWMVNAGITSGTTPTTFSPHQPVTRGQIATFLHRLEGEPIGGSTPFVDVPPSAYYAEAVAWLVNAGITAGTSPTTFEPDRAVTRGELATLLYRYHGSPSVTVLTGVDCPTAPLAVQLNVAEAMSMKLLNDLRSSLGKDPLARVSSMAAAARNWSRTMHDTGDFKHSDLPYAENIAWWSASWASPETAAEMLHDLWVNSPGHYANMVNASYRSFGAGFWRGGGGWYGTHLFHW